MIAPMPGPKKPQLSCCGARYVTGQPIAHRPGCGQGGRGVAVAAMPEPKPADAGLAKAGRSHYSATRTTCALGHSHPSKTEARACAVVNDRYPNATIFRNARLPLWCLTPTDAGIPHYVNIDFVVVAEGGDPIAFIDAKCGKRSRDWERGRAAAQATYGIAVEELEA